MTKKSDARILRDKNRKEQEDNIKAEGRRGWDEVRQISEASMAMLIIPLEFKDALRNHKLIAFLNKTEREDLVMKIRLLEKDLLTMLENIKPIRAKHLNRTGLEKDYDEVFVTYGLVEEYVAWQSQYDAFILPTKADIIQYLSDAEARQNAHTRTIIAQHAAATDENPIEVRLVHRDGSSSYEDKYGNPVAHGTKIRVIEEPAEVATA